MDTKLVNLIKKPIVIDPYYYKVYVVVGSKEFDWLVSQNPEWYTIEAHEPHVKRPLEQLTGAYGGVYRVKADNDADMCILQIDDLKDKMLDRTIIHECLHVVLGMFDSRGLPIDVGNEEAMCYHLEHLWQEVTNLIKKRAD